MAFIFADSLETITAAADLALRGWTVGGSPVVETGAGLFKDGTQSVYVEANENFVNDLPSTYDIVNTSFWFRKNHAQAAIFFRYRGTGSGEARLHLQADDTVDIIDHGSTNHGSSGAVVTSDEWHHIEFRWRFNNSITLGDCQLWINGVKEVEVAATTDTQFSTENVIDKIEFESDNDVGNKHYIDSIVCWSDVAGDNFVGNLGQIRIETVAPDSTGNYADFTGSDADSTNNYLHVDEINTLHDSDTSYTESLTATDKDTYGYTALTGSIDSIVGVQTVVVAKKTDTDARGIKPMTRVSSTDYLGSETLLTNGTYVAIVEMWDDNPNTSTAWTETTVNGAEFGIEVST